MPLDLDGLVNKSAVTIFGDGNTAGTPIRYTRRIDGTYFDLDGIYDEAWLTVEAPSGRHGVPVSTTKPCFGCRLNDFPQGVEPAQGDTILRKSITYTIADIQPDGFGWIYLILN